MGRSKRFPRGKGRMGVQVGALCWRVQSGKIQVLMVTSRRTERWIMPKGWLDPGRTGDEAAATEAWEEAGARGRLHEAPVGTYRYIKVGERKQSDIPCEVAVYPMKVRNLASEWPEMRERRRSWMSRKKAAKHVWEPELSRIIKQFNPKLL